MSVETAEDGDFWNHVVIPITVGVLGCMFGSIPIHSACLAYREGGLLLAGVSGAGKSTLAVALAREGFDLVSDDWTYITLHDGTLKAHGLSVPVKLLPDASGHFEELTSLSTCTALNGELAYEIDITQLGARSAKSCHPSCLVFVDRHSDRTGLERLSPETAVEFFRRSCERLPERLCNGHLERERVLGAIRMADVWLLRYSGTPHAGAGRLKMFYEENYGCI